MKEKIDETWRYFINKFDPDARWFWATVLIGVIMFVNILAFGIYYTIYLIELLKNN